MYQISSPETDRVKLKPCKTILNLLFSEMSRLHLMKADLKTKSSTMLKIPCTTGLLFYIIDMGLSERQLCKHQ